MNGNNDQMRKQEERAYLDTLALLDPGFQTLLTSPCPKTLVGVRPLQLIFRQPPGTTWHRPP